MPNSVMRIFLHKLNQAYVINSYSGFCLKALSNSFGENYDQQTSTYFLVTSRHRESKDGPRRRKQYKG